MSLLKNKRYLVLLSGQLVSSVGNNLFSIALPWFVLATTHSSGDVAITGFFQSLSALGGLFAGVLVDRWRKKQTMIVTDMIRAVISIILFFLALNPRASFVLIVVLVLLMGLVGTMFGPAFAALTPKIVQREEFATAEGLGQSASSIAKLVGALGGGALMAMIGPPLLFLGNGISFLVSVFTLCLIRVSEEKPSAVRRFDSSFWSDWKQGFRIMIKSKFIVMVTIVFAIANFSLAPFGMFLTVWVKEKMHGTALDLGMIEGSFLAGAIVGGLLLGPLSKRVQVKTELWASLIVVGVCVSLFGQNVHLYWAIACIVLVGLAIGILNGSVGALILQSIPESMIGRVIGPLQALTTVATPAGMGIFGALLVHLSLQWLYVVMGACCVLSGMSLLLPIKNDIQEMGADLNATV